jgi:hypothetical protein
VKALRNTVSGMDTMLNVIMISLKISTRIGNLAILKNEKIIICELHLETND